MLGTEITEHVLFDIGPDEFNRIQFWCVRREILHRQSRLAFDEGGQRLRFMNAGVVQEEGDLAGHVMKNVLNEGEHLWPPDRAWVSLLQKLSTRGDCPNGGEFLPVGLGRQDRRLTTGCPGAGDGGLQAEAHFIREDQRLPRVDLFFPTRGRGRSPKSPRPLPSVPSPGDPVSVGRIPTDAVSG